jgi:hypothetical protein
MKENQTGYHGYPVKAKEQYFSCSSSSCISTNKTFINTGVINN